MHPFFFSVPPWLNNNTTDLHQFEDPSAFLFYLTRHFPPSAPLFTLDLTAIFFSHKISTIHSDVASPLPLPPAPPYFPPLSFFLTFSLFFLPTVVLVCSIHLVLMSSTSPSSGASSPLLLLPFSAAQTTSLSAQAPFLLPSNTTTVSPIRKQTVCQRISLLFTSKFLEHVCRHLLP